MVAQIEAKTSKNTNIIYPDSDGQPMADNTKQFRWITVIYYNLEWLFGQDENVFVAGDLLWYPVEGNNKLRQAPDVMVVFGAKKGDRGSYMQWKEQGIPPQVSRWAEITTDPIRGKRKEERGKRKYILYSLFSILSPSYRRESKAYRRGTKSAINYVHLLSI